MSREVLERIEEMLRELEESSGSKEVRRAWLRRRLDEGCRVCIEDVAATR